MTNQEREEELVFNLLKREGECWHEGQFNCKKCGYDAGFSAVHRSNPNFSTPEGFFWMWDRLQEKEWVGDFWDWIYDKAHDQYFSLTGKKMPQAWYWMTRFTGELRKENNLINPQALFQAVLGWVKETP